MGTAIRRPLDPAACADLTEAARAALGDGRGALEATRDAVLSLLPPEPEPRS